MRLSNGIARQLQCTRSLYIDFIFLTASYLTVELSIIMSDYAQRRSIFVVKLRNRFGVQIPQILKNCWVRQNMHGIYKGNLSSLLHRYVKH